MIAAVTLIFAALPLTGAFVPTTNGPSFATSLPMVVTGPKGKPAASSEEDLALTLQVILAHQGDDAAATSEPEAAVDVPKEKKEKKKKKKKKKQPAPDASAEIDVSKLDVRVGVITKAWDHPEADKLYCEEIDIGEKSGPRQIASGLRAHYASADDLVGQRVLVLANLKSRKLVRFPSHGMVLCACEEGDDGKVEFVVPPADAQIGERVMVDGFDGEPATENQVIKKKMLNAIFPDLKTNDDGVATYRGVAMATSAGSCKSGLSNAIVS